MISFFFRNNWLYIIVTICGFLYLKEGFALQNKPFAIDTKETAD